jgi:DNA polymerase III subunit gamma/tau
MALDTKYRPQTYDEVLGQHATVAVLRQFVVEGRGFHQSYVFCGQHGSGKTTLGRLLARALLCESPFEGSPCDQCASCLTFLNGDTHECFVELDAATKSGKADLTRILEDVQYSTVSGKRRIYLFDESHRLSKQALDALLKPMEDNAPGSEDKRLVCIFCTTEPEKMVGTIFSRCAPAFVIRVAPSEEITDRLDHICEQEGLVYDHDALELIVEQSESHIRDALKMVEGVSMLGEITQKNVASYLHLDANDGVLDLLASLGGDLPEAIRCATTLSKEVSPSSAYERLAEASMLAYRVHLGVAGRIPSKWNSEKVEALALRGSAWLNVATRFAAPPHRPTRQTLVLDAASAHHFFGGVLHVASESFASPAPPSTLPSPAPSPSTTETHPTSTPSDPPVGNVAHATTGSSAHLTTTNVWVDPRAVGGGPDDRVDPAANPQTNSESHVLTPNVFRELVQHHLRGLRRGRTGSSHMGGTGTQPSR